MHREDHRVALRERHHLGARLHARPLLGDHELAARRSRGPAPTAGSPPAAGTRARHRGPDAGSCSRRRRMQQERRRPVLAGRVAALQESGVAVGIAHVAPIARSSDWRWRELRIERGAQVARSAVRQRIGEVLVFAAAETVARHHDATAEVRVVGIERGERAAFVGREKPSRTAQPCGRDPFRPAPSRSRRARGGDVGGGTPGGSAELWLSCEPMWTALAARPPPDFPRSSRQKLRCRPRESV